MPYIGNIPASQFAALTYQDLTGGSGTSFTLDTSVGSAQDIEVFVNNVRQEPGVAYTISGGTTLNMTGTIAATDDFYVVFQGKAVGTITHPSNSALQATTGTFSGALSATTGTFSGAVSMGANNITFSDGSGIDFSASAGSGASSSILHDYEEGTYTPTVRTGTVSTVSGEYTKIGQLVTVTVYISTLNDVSSSNSLEINLPFTCNSNSDAYIGSVMTRYVSATTSEENGLAVYVANGWSYARIYQIVDSASYVDIKHSDYSDTAVGIRLTISYRTTA